MNTKKIKARSRAPEILGDLKGRTIPHIGVLSRVEMLQIMNLGDWFREDRDGSTYADLLKGRIQALLFVYASTRTRLGFEIAFAQLGGSNIYMPVEQTQMGRGESAADIARVMEHYVDCFTGRLWRQEDIDAFAANMTKPVFNACTPLDHGTQVLGELMAIRQAKGKLAGLNLVYAGMARGIMHSLVRCCPLLGINLVLGIPPSYVETINSAVMMEGQEYADRAGTRLEVVTDLKKAVKGTDFVQAGTLIRSMLAGEQSPEEKMVKVEEWMVTDEILDCAHKDVLYSHSGPAYRGVCATAHVMDGKRQIIASEALNAIYSKKAMMALNVN